MLKKLQCSGNLLMGCGIFSGLCIEIQNIKIWFPDISVYLSEQSLETIRGMSIVNLCMTIRSIVKC